ncbi:diguanylate cyclase [Devosia nitrariae]|uniref:Diguanylate cyclase n=1 Tax=Devosia nitrariae TaxID=2071872 RepID=A0ABQ5W8J3_9HYPH|nr:diguanylate cyclase [Devosia nitrariae]
MSGWRRWLRPTLIPAVITTVVIILAGFYADQQNTQLYEQSLRAKVVDQVWLIRAKLEGNINGNIQLVRGFIGTIATEPDIDQERFSELAANLFEEHSQLRNIAAAPDMVVELIYPLAGNESAIGLDYTTNPQQREAALRVKESGNVVLAGPVDLVQGGWGFVARFPVYNRLDGQPVFWGLVSAVIDADRLYSESGLTDPNLPIDIAIVGKDALGAQGRPFYGDESVLTRDPVTAGVTLPTGWWQIAAVPKVGWNGTPPNAWLLRVVIATAGLVILVPMVIAGRLMDERQRHIRELGQREALLAKLSRRLGLALDTSRIGVWEMDIVTNHLVWDDRMNELYGLKADGGERSYHDWRGALHPEDIERAERDFRQGIETGRYASQFRVVDGNGRVRVIRTIGAVYTDPGENPRIIGVNWDVTSDVARNEDLERAKRLTEARNRQLEAAKARIEHNALHDSLTGLPNRRYLDDTLKVRAASGDGAGIALLHIDLDRFKQINDTLGHAAGDAVLVHAAKVLRRNAGREDFVARVGGDEFVVVCVAAPGQAALGELANRIIADMRVPVVYQGHECRCGVSVGIAMAASPAADGKSLLVDADIALYRAKARGRSRYEFFSEALQAEVVNTKRVADEILNGIDRGEFLAHYQPQFDAHTHDVVGVEALARWRHPVHGLLTPDRFLDIAEELNAVSTIDRMILEQALADFNDWRQAGLGVPRVSVNVSLRRLHDEDLIAGLEQLAFTPGTVSFELVESIYLDERDETVAWNIDQLKELGIDIEIDDFGTGYASIVSLQNLRPKRLKIDRLLVSPITEDPAQWRLLSSIIDIGKALGIEVLAEGVETMEHARILSELGCEVLQGYAFAKPMDSEALKAFLAAQPWRKAS